MKHRSFPLFIIFLIFISMSVQAQQTFLYEITLYEAFQHRSMWSEREHQIQNEHMAYLDSLTQAGSLHLAGIVDQGLENHTGLIILTSDSYEAARRIVAEDPSVQKGMMRARLRPIQIYFEKRRED